MNVSQIFNSSLEVGSWLSASDTNFTGSLTLSILVLLGFVLLVSAILKMPQLLLLIAVFPLIIVLTSINEFNSIGGTVIAILILIGSFALISLWPAK